MKIAVVGAGVMGTNHARTVAANRDVELVAIADPDLDRATALAAAHGGVPVADIMTLGDRFDAAIVATPTAHHHSLAMALISARKHVLIEKPIAVTVHDANALVEAARHAGVSLMVGHVERFNPVVLALPEVLDQPVHFEAFRIGPFTSRVPDSVVLDLMIHDIDIVTRLTGSPVVKTQAVGQSRRSNSDDMVTALLTFENGMTAALTASRLGQQKVREFRITQHESVITADLLRQQIEVNRMVHTEYLGEQGRRYRQSGSVEMPFIENLGEPLAQQLRSFVRRAQAGRTDESTLVDAKAAVSALGTAIDVMTACRAGVAVE
jgi:UDP-N-acetylglucosamine 3-dehydrogenase